MAQGRVSYFAFASNWEQLAHRLGVQNPNAGDGDNASWAKAVVEHLLEQSGGPALMIGFDAGDVAEHDPDAELDPVEDTKPELAGALGLVLGPKGKGTRRSIYVEGPGGPTNGDWDTGEILRALKAAKMLVAANPKDAKLSSLKKYVDGIDFKKVKSIMREEGAAYRAFQREFSERFLPLWHDGAWWRATASQLEGFKKEGYSAAEVDNLSELFELDSEDNERRKRAIAGLIEFYANHYKPAFDAGKVPPLVMKNLTGEALVAVGAAFGADMAMFADFHIFEIDDKYSEPSRKANKKARDEENAKNKKRKEAIESDIRRASGALRIAAVFSYISGKYCAEGAYELPEEAIAKVAPEAAVAMGIAEAAAGAGGMTLTPAQRLICERVINVFETGSIRGDYANISIYHDGPHRIRQVTYGRAQTTEYGNLRHLVQMYVDNGGRFADDLRPFVALIGRTALVDNEAFKRLLRRAGREDPIMASTQDVFFDTDYFQPALRWASAQGFSAALSMLVIYDSFVHSGGMRDEIRSRFPELPPAAGGDEKAWISQYVAARHQWLANHSNPDLHPTAYRMVCFRREIARDNWDLGKLPIIANGVPVDGTGTAGGVPPPRTEGARVALEAFKAESEIPDLSAMDEALAELGEFDTGGEGEIWGDDRAVLASAPISSEGAPSEAASIGRRILDNPAIKLATAHASGVPDEATARQNMLDTADGHPARRSSYRGAPGGTVALDIRMLKGLRALGERYSLAISELCGGSHNPNSRHYAGLAFDINEINGRHVSLGHRDAAAVMAMCRALGATEVLGPGDRNHSTHVHAAWPRP